MPKTTMHLISHTEQTPGETVEYFCLCGYHSTDVKEFINSVTQSILLVTCTALEILSRRPLEIHEN